jgi:hypothetical protein
MLSRARFWRPTGRGGGIEDAADDNAIGQDIVIIVLPSPDGRGADARLRISEFIRRRGIRRAGSRRGVAAGCQYWKHCRTGMACRRHRTRPGLASACELGNSVGGRGGGGFRNKMFWPTVESQRVGSENSLLRYFAVRKFPKFGSAFTPEAARGVDHALRCGPIANDTCGQPSDVDY